MAAPKRTLTIFGTTQASGTGVVAMVYFAFSILVLIPVMVTRYPPLVDYPNHLARCYILHNLGDNAVLAGYYRNVMAAQPNLALDLIVPQLNRLVSIWTAGRLFIAATLLVLAFGCIALHRALHERLSAWPAVGFLFLYNRLLLWGFLGYLFGLGVALLAAAGWIGIERYNKAARLAYGMFVATIIYLLHLYALGIYGVLIGGFMVADWMGVRRSAAERAGRLMIVAAGFVPAAFLFLFVSPTAAAAGRFVWGGLFRKLTEPFKLMVAYQPRADVVWLAVVAATVGVLLVRRQLGVARAGIPVLVGLAILLIAMPNELFSSFGADRRIPIAFVLVAIATIDWDVASGSLRVAVMLGAAMVMALQIGAVTAAWRRSQPIYQRVIAALDDLPVGARLLAAVPATAPSFPPLYHVDAYAVILRDAFVPSLFAAPQDAGSSLGFTARYQALRDRTPAVVMWAPMLDRLRGKHYARTHGPFRAGLLADYDAALVVDPALVPAPARPPADCPAMVRTAGFVLLRLPCGHS